MKITVVGCGVMGSAFAKHFAKEHTLILCDRHLEKRKALAAEIGGKAESQIRDAVANSEVILLSVKPKDLSALAEELKGVSLKGKIILSLLTGASVQLLKSQFPQAQVVRIMPNLGIAYKQGVTGIVEDSDLLESTKKSIDSLLKGLGLNLWMAENKIDSLIALSGSGIGFVLVMIESMLDGGVFLGFNAKDSREIVLETLKGAVALMEHSGKHPAELKLQISSPGGTTIAGLKKMEEAGVRSGILSTLNACYEKALNITTSMKSVVKT